MDLKQFVKQALVQIAQGVKESQKALNAYTNDPASNTTQQTGAQSVDFSVALRVDSSEPDKLVVVNDQDKSVNDSAVRVMFNLPLDSDLLSEQERRELKSLTTDSIAIPRYNEVYVCY